MPDLTPLVSSSLPDAVSRVARKLADLFDATGQPGPVAALPSKWRTSPEGKLVYQIMHHIGRERWGDYNKAEQNKLRFLFALICQPDFDPDDLIVPSETAVTETRIQSLAEVRSSKLRETAERTEEARIEILRAMTKYRDVRAELLQMQTSREAVSVDDSFLSSVSDMSVSPPLPLKKESLSILSSFTATLSKRDAKDVVKSHEKLDQVQDMLYQDRAEDQEIQKRLTPTSWDISRATGKPDWIGDAMHVLDVRSAISQVYAGRGLEKLAQRFTTNLSQCIYLMSISHPAAPSVLPRDKNVIHNYGTVFENLYATTPQFRAGYLIYLESSIHSLKLT
jgi:hypothetical protein